MRCASARRTVIALKPGPREEPTRKGETLWTVIALKPGLRRRG